MRWQVGEAGIEDMAKPDCGALAPLVTAVPHACMAVDGGRAGQVGGRWPVLCTLCHSPGSGCAVLCTQGVRPMPAATHRLVSAVVLEIMVRGGVGDQLF